MNQRIPQLPPPTSRKRRSGEGIFDLITVFFIIASVGVLIGTILIISDPSVPFNPFPLAELPTRFQTPTPTITFTPSTTPTLTVTPLPPTLTSTVTLSPTMTSTSTATITVTPVIPGIENIPTVTPSIAITGASTPIPTVFTDSPFPFIAREVRYEQNTNDRGCQWLSIAGNVTGFNSEPLTDLVVEINGEDFEFIVFTGSNPLFGVSGFEVELGSEPSRGEYSVRLIGPLGLPISDFIAVITGSTCEDNVAIVEFIQVRDY